MKKFRLFLLFFLLTGGGAAIAQTGEEEIDLKNEPVYRNLSKALRNADKVYKLNLSKENLKEFPEDILKLKELRYLTLDSNLITSIPAGISGLQKMSYFSISGNLLTEIPGSFGELSNLEYVYLDNNQITSLPVEFFKLAKLRELFINSNQISSLPREIKVLKELRRLVAANNKLTGLPDEIGYVYNLRKLSLSKNQIKELPEHFYELNNLTGLYLSKNQLEKLDPKINKLNKMETLALDGNKLQSLPPEIGELIELKYLYLEENKLDSLPKEMSELFKLKELFIGDNAIKKIPVEYNRLTNLTYLNVKGLTLQPFPQVMYDLQNKGTKIVGLTTNELYNAKVLLSSARNKRLVENFPEAIKKFEQLISLDTNNVIAMSELASLYLNAGEFDKASALCKRALTKNASEKTLDELRTTYSNSLNRTSQSELIIKSFEAKIQAEPSKADPLFYLGKYYFDQLKMDDAKRLFLQAIKVDPFHADSHFYLAVIFLKEDKKDLFVLSALRSFELQPGTIKTSTMFPFVLTKLKMRSGKTNSKGNISYFDSYIIRNESNEIVYKSESPQSDLLVAILSESLQNAGAKGEVTYKDSTGTETDGKLSKELSEQLFYTGKSNTEIFQIEFKKLCENYSAVTKPEEKVFWDYYFPFYDAIIKGEHFETYSNIINDIRGFDPKNAKWLKTNAAKHSKYTDWMKKFSWQKP